ncbi:hypothetical protein [Methylobacterium marchantiae]|uniref:SRPBCC family protein n=1 Tax=Methylobacterium marchantiae TaxID=600331 RepID=A0ABW3WVF1_9HYPH|nr:hypothetical protein AIGOOFII_3438 [Methylobacterium marchantiae]
MLRRRIAPADIAGTIKIVRTLAVANNTIGLVLKHPDLFASRSDSFQCPLVSIHLAAVRGDRGALTLGRYDGAIEERCPLWMTAVSQQRFSAATDGMTASEQELDGTGLALSFDWAPIRSRSGQEQTELVLRIRYRLEPFWLDEMAHALRDLAENTMHRIVDRTRLNQDA